VAIGQTVLQMAAQK